MGMENFDMENYLRVVRKVAENMGMDLVERDGGWSVTFVDKRGNEFNMVMFDLGLNNSLVNRTVSDKSRCYDALVNSGVPAVPHYFYMYPNSTFRTMSLLQTMAELNGMLNEYGSIVVKANNGGAGRDVYMVRNEMELDIVAVDLFSRKESIAVSPLVDYEIEYRVIVLDGEVKMSFGKRRGDDFKHNLSAGSLVVDVPDYLRDELYALAINAVDSVGARFASVDIVDHVDGLKVLEINGTVTLKRVAAASDKWFERCVSTYESALKKVVDSYYDEVYSK